MKMMRKVMINYKENHENDEESSDKRSGKIQ